MWRKENKSFIDNDGHSTNAIMRIGNSYLRRINLNLFKGLVPAFLCFSASNLHAQQANSKFDSRIEFSKLDSNNNYVLEKAELSRIWPRIKEYDINNDLQLTFAEYSTVDLPYLKTNGSVNLNVKYKTTKEEDLYLDIYYPPSKSDMAIYPVLIYTHGGGWFNGSKENSTKAPMNTPLSELVEKGFAVVAINYRLTRTKSVVMRDCIIDAMDALRYLSKNSDSLHLDTTRVYAFGDSAGGQIAQMLTLADPNNFKGDATLYDSPYKVLAGVSWYGPSDFTVKELFETDDPTKEADRFSSRITKTESNPKKIKAMYKEMSPIFYLNKNSPPLYMMAADNDTTIPVGHAYHMKSKADSLGANVEILIVKNAGHNWRKAGGEIDPTLAIIAQKTVDFFLKYEQQ